MNTITIIGSINVDTTYKVKDFPKPGETIQVGECVVNGGGKGANQAIAAARNGAKTFFIGGVGTDAQGTAMRNALKENGVDVSGVVSVAGAATGSACILLNEQGENCIMICSGANGELSAGQVAAHSQSLAGSDFVIAQMETNISSTMEAFQTARKHTVKTILNPAPASREIPSELYQRTDLIIPNQSETELLTGICISDENSLAEAASIFHRWGIEAVIITLGSKGAYYDREGIRGIVPALKVRAVDTTAAGDTFIGALASVLKTDFSNLEEAVFYGNQASSLAVQKYGAQPSIPTRAEIEACYIRSV